MCKNNKIKIETGRSMVEMLGTLAIIGVLSVGGIAGYSYGMDKYRANTIINDVMLRSVDALAQFDSTGDANLSEWPTTTVGKYTIGLENDTIGIQVSGLPKRLCKMVFDGLINQSTIKIGTTEYDSPTDDVCGDTNTMVFYVDEAPLNTDNTENENDTATETETETTTILSCNCGENQYCADKNTSTTQANPGRECASLNFREEVIDGTTYYISNEPMSWWDAVSACEALGNKQLLSRYDLTQSCNYDDTGCSSTSTKLSDFGMALYEKVNGVLVWVKERNSEGYCGSAFLKEWELGGLDFWWCNVVNNYEDVIAVCR